MIDLSQLKKPERHPLKAVFIGYSTARLGQILKVSPGYLQNVLLGHVRGSDALNQKITALASDIQAAERSTPSKDSK